MKKGIQLKNKIFLAFWGLGPAVFVWWQSKTIQKAQVQKFETDCFSKGFGFKEVGKLHILTS